MSDIRVGDLVQVISECCPYDSSLWEFHHVLSIEIAYGDCAWCEDSATEPLAHLDGGEDDECHWIPVRWLRRIPPLSELESTETTESIPA